MVLGFAVTVAAWVVLWLLNPQDTSSHFYVLHTQQKTRSPFYLLRSENQLGPGFGDEQRQLGGSQESLREIQSDRSQASLYEVRSRFAGPD